MLNTSVSHTIHDSLNHKLTLLIKKLINITTINCLYLYPFVELLYEINPTVYQYLTDLGIVRYRFKKLNDVNYIHNSIKKRFSSIVKSKIKTFPKEYKAGVYTACCKSGDYRLINICEEDGMGYSYESCTLASYYLTDAFKNCYRKAKEIVKNYEKYNIDDGHLMVLSIEINNLQLFKKSYKRYSYRYSIDFELFIQHSINFNATKILKFLFKYEKIQKEKIRRFYDYSVFVNSECKYVILKYLE